MRLCLVIRFCLVIGLCLWIRVMFSDRVEIMNVDMLRSNL